MLFPEFCGRKPEFFFESPVEAGVIVEPILIDQRFQWNPGEDSIFACVQAFLDDVLVERNTHMVFKQMGNVVFADIKEICQPIQG